MKTIPGPLWRARRVDGPTEASYVNLQMWVQAALEAGSGDVAQVQRTILRQSLPAPEGVVRSIP